MSVAQTSTLWNVAATPWLYRSVILDFDKNKSVLTARLLEKLLKTDNEQPMYRHYVQTLNINMPSTEARRRLKPCVLTVLARLIPLLPMLKSFTYVSTLSADMLRSPLMHLQMGSSRANSDSTARSASPSPKTVQSSCSLHMLGSERRPAISRKSWGCGQSFGACHRLQATPTCHYRTACGVDVLSKAACSQTAKSKVFDHQIQRRRRSSVV